MTIIRDRATINLTEEERKAIKTVKDLVNDLYYGLKSEELDRFNNIMRASWTDPDSVKVAICDLSCILDSFQSDINKFNESI